MKLFTLAASLLSLSSAAAMADQCLVLTPWQKQRAADLINRQDINNRFVLSLCEPCGQRWGSLVQVHHLGYVASPVRGYLHLTVNGREADMAYTYVYNYVGRYWFNVGMEIGCPVRGVTRYLPTY
jgi:hypothetical protein